MKKSFIDTIIKILLALVIINIIMGFISDNFIFVFRINYFYKIAIILFIITAIVTFINLTLKRKILKFNKVINYKIGINIEDLNKIILQNDFKNFNESNYVKNTDNNELIIISIHKNKINLDLQNDLYKKCFNNNIQRISNIILYITNKKEKDFIKNITFKESEIINTLICGITLEDNMLYLLEKDSSKNYLKYSELKELILNILQINK